MTSIKLRASRAVWPDGKKISKLRKAKGFSQKALSLLSGGSGHAFCVSTLKAAENEWRTCKYSTLQDIASVLGVSAKEILRDE